MVIIFTQLQYKHDVIDNILRNVSKIYFYLIEKKQCKKMEYRNGARGRT